ncbi:hypothetical protein MPTK1_5g09000 [Marchantia polymorpha subsp. ruderalis]|uniref:Uncharacterized protein n=2 Tax=Marchantia polymorpha TaxID=3197 RepID=A0AAF6BGG1_MARPO|nr:hypothetical protein MARPO_0095s0058 [Marchantia polymorpha]PTQ32802.1 hypothetical protein MARPO_0095s0058 [Marchantia polymorpha]BBN11095.1 hypothetical protein Mp_5g09000 [Marchantia polymorpha subsp. ruderalis]BBN11096.1 hypothetical protein Mp_5g09000 [Marchantia polymorpha subsp. ruderalis]|eukprot:PTQ32801.1 hypothetical protein MARPO_0095s0058 [Marchantia polymorpha]
MLTQRARPCLSGPTTSLPVSNSSSSTARSLTPCNDFNLHFQMLIISFPAAVPVHFFRLYDEHELTALAFSARPNYGLNSEETRYDRFTCFET